MSILSEGFDAEDMQSVFIRPSSKLPAVQMGGRVLRKCDSIPTKQIIQCQDTHHPFVKTARAHASYIQVGSEFRSLSRNDNVDKIAQQMAAKVLAAECSMPEFITRNQKKVIRGADLEEGGHMRFPAGVFAESGRRSPRRRRRRGV